MRRNILDGADFVRDVSNSYLEFTIAHLIGHISHRRDGDAYRGHRLVSVIIARIDSPIRLS
jgi:hypothetical protein